jgi:tetratricopeptide (TPR) repeat protein
MSAARALVVPILSLAVLGFIVQEERGNRAYRKGEPTDAVERYREALAEGDSDPRLRYNLGTALLGTGELEEARVRLREALESQDPELRTSAFYNLGNASARGAAGARREREPLLRGAVDAYRRALLLDPEDEDARWNLELALRRLEQEEEERATMPGPGPEPFEEPEGGERRDRSQPGAEPPRAGAPQTGQPPEELQLQDAGMTPLAPELAEQILRAVEEQERGLQRERMRQRHPSRRAGPDW